MALWDEPTEINDDTVFGKRLNDKALQKMPDATGGSMTLLNPRYGLLSARNRGGVRPTLPNRDPENDRPGPDDRLLPSDFIPDVDEERNRFSPYQPVAPFGPPSILDAREWDYPTGYNLEIVNRHIVLGEMLRGIVRGSGIIANELSARVDELVSLPWKFVLKNPAKGVKSEDDPRIKELNAFFKMPDRKIPYPQWMEMIFRERYTIDAATVYIWKNRAGTKPYALEVIDGNTIVPKIDDRGRIPDWPSLAYVQIVKGLPMDNFTEREIVYMPRHRWAQNPIWGYSEVEQILMEATQQVRKTMYMLNFWAEGTCPDVMVCCPENWCYSEDTEVLTQRGWKRFTDVDIESDKFATRKPVTKEFQWQKATGINLQPYSGEMVHLQSRSIDCLVNPPHRVLLSKRNGDERIVLAKELLESHIDGDRIPIVSNWNEGKEIKTRVFSQITKRGGGFALEMTGDQYCAFMGAWLAEGHTACSGRVAGITQASDGKGFAAYWELVNNIKIKGKAPSYDGKSIIVCNAPLGRYLSKFGHASEKYVPAEIMNATPRQIEIFLRYYALGDGSKTAPVIYTSSRKMADQLQELVQKTGKSATIAEDDRRGRKLKFDGNREGNTNHISYIVSMSDSKMRRFSVASEQYSGMIGCVSVPNGILYVRRNGKACWSGNTAEQIALWQGTFDALMSGNLKLKSKMRFIPGGGKPFEMKGSAGDLLKSEYDEWMARIVCRAFRTDPKPYIKEPEPRANSEQLQEQMRAQGLNGEMLWWSSLMERLIFLGWGWDDISHAFDQNEEVAATDQATIDAANTSLGARTINELRDRDGLDAVEGGDVPMVKTGTGWMPLAVLAAQKAMPQPAMGGASGDSGPGKPGAQQPSKQASVKKEAGTEADRPLAKRGSHWSRY